MMQLRAENVSKNKIISYDDIIPKFSKLKKSYQL